MLNKYLYMFWTDIQRRIAKYRHNLLFGIAIVASIYIDFVFFYAQLEYPVFSGIPPVRWLYTLLSTLVLASPWLFLKRERIGLLWVALLLLDFLFFIPNTVYFRYYHNVIPLSSYFELGNLFEISTSLHAYVTAKDFFYLINTGVLYLLYRLFFKGRLNCVQRKYKIMTAVSSLVLFLAFFGGSAWYTHVKSQKPLLHKFEVGIFDQSFYVSYYGVIPLWIYQCYQYFQTDREGVSADEKIKIGNYLRQSATATGHAEQMLAKNLIVVVVESFSSWVTKFEGGMATPFLSELAKNDSSVIFLPNVLGQVSHGGSGDAQLMYNTGLLPVCNGAASSLYDGQYYPSLAENLRFKGDFFSATVVGDRGSMWNQKKMNLAYGIDTLITKNELVQDDMIEGKISDKSVFRQLPPILKQQFHKPFYTQVITLSSHDGFVFDSMQTALPFPGHYPRDIINFIKSMEYADQALALFVEELKKAGIYDDSVIAIIGDHPARGMGRIGQYDKDLLNPLEDEKDGFVPLYIINSGRKFRQDSHEVIGQIDIYPTLLDIMGCNENYWKGLGTSIFSPKPPTFAVSKELKVIGDTTGYTKEEIQHKIDAWSMSDLIIRKKYFETIKDNDKNKHYEQSIN